MDLQSEPTPGGNEIFEISFDSEIDVPADSETSDSGGTTAAQPSVREEEPERAPSRGDDYIQGLERRVQQAERVSNELSGAVRAMLAQSQRPNADPNAPPVSLEQLEQGGDVKDLINYVNWMVGQNMAHFSTQADFAARRAAATQQVRGLMNQNEMGRGRDYDALRGKHLDDLYRQNPNIEPLLHAAAFDNPALAEYTLAAVYEIVDSVKGDPVKGFKAIWNALDAYKSGSRDTTQRLNEAFDRQADRILRGNGAQGRTVKVGSSEDIERMSDDEFERFYNQTGS